MVPARRNSGFRSGITLIETMVAAAILLIAVLGTSSARYTAAMESRQARAKMTAARIALVLCESWRGSYGSEDYDPLQLASDDLTIADAADGEGPSVPNGLTSLGTYSIQLNQDDDSNVKYYATMSWTDVETGLRALNVVVGWIQRDTGDIEYSSANLDKTFQLTTYSETF